MGVTIKRKSIISVLSSAWKYSHRPISYCFTVFDATLFLVRVKT